MKTRNRITVSLLLLFVSAAFISIQQNNNKKKQTPAPKPAVSGSYEQLWARVDSLTKKGLSKSALEQVMVIYAKAKTEDNPPELVKAVIHRMKFQSYTEEDATKKMIADLKQECATSDFPARPLLHSMLAETYFHFYEQNRYRFLNRTETVEYKNDDINTWDLKKIIHETVNEYHLSLADEEKSKRAQIDIYEDVLNASAESRKLRPSLYDFLAHRALDFFKSDETGLVEPANKFEITESSYLDNSDLFLKMIFHTDDTLSLKFNAIKILQNLIEFHSHDAHPGALIDVDIERIKFVHENLRSPDKDTAYLHALHVIEQRYNEYPGSTDALFEVASYYKEQGEKYSSGQNPDSKLLIKKANEICDEAISRFPYSQGGLNCKYLKSHIEEKTMNFTMEQVNIPDQPFRAKLEYKNIRKIYFRIVKNDRDKHEETDENGEQLIEDYLGRDVIKQWNVDVDDEGDYQTHSVEIKIPELPIGGYVVLAGSSPDFKYVKNAVAYAPCWMSNISYVSRRRQDDGYDFYLLQRETGDPLPNVTAQLYTRKYDYLGRKYEYVKLQTFTSNADGFFSIPSISDYRDFDIEFTSGSDHLFLNDNFYQYRYNRDNRNVRTQTFFFTDRSIYRPRQTVYFKGIMIETDGEKNSVKTKQSTVVTFYDVNGQKISDQTLVTNDYGTFSGSFTAPVGLLNGAMRIGNENGSLYFSVEEYKRPKFEVKFEPVTGSYRLNDKISVKAKAIAYSGANIDNASVQYHVVRNTIFPYWNYYWRSYPASPQMEIAHGTATTNGNGEFTISFDAIPDLSIGKESDPVFNYTISADVTDVNGETQSGSQVISAGYKSLLISVNIPEQLNKEVAKDFVISTRNLSGAFTEAKGNIEITKLKEPLRLLRKRRWTKTEKQLLTREEYEKTFPYDIYSEEDNPEKWEGENTVMNNPFDTEKDSMLHLTDMKPWKEGVYKLEVKSKDKYGENVKFVKFITIFSPKEKQSPVNSISWFSVLKDNAEPGGTDQLLIGTHDKNVKVLYEIERKGEVVSKQWLTLTNEKRLIEIPVVESYRGNIAVHFTFVKHNSSYSFDHVLSVPYTNKALDISFETFRSKLYPGQKEEWKIKIKGSAGEKVASEMLATMYDASLDAFKPHNWLFNIYQTYYSTLNLETYRSFGAVNSIIYSQKWNVYLPIQSRGYDQLNWFGYNFYSGYYMDGINVRGSRSDMTMSYEDIQAAPATSPQKAETATTGNSMALGKNSKAFKEAGDRDQSNLESGETTRKEGRESQNISGIKGRTNFNETAFFYPQLTTNDSGEVLISFTIPEAMTRWKMMGFASTADLKYGMIEKELITQKELMVVPDPPRFFREGDKISFTTKITNLSDTALKGTTQLFLYDAITMQPINIFSADQNEKGEQSFTASKGESTTAAWNLQIPEAIGAITYKVVAKAANYSDGEEQTIPVLSNRMLVTETMPLPIRGKQNKSFEFTKLKNSATSTTLRNHKLTLEFTSNPAWYAVQALPYLIEYPYECSEQIFSRYYANSIASHIANSSRKIKAVFDSWRAQSADALLSNLEKNQELKTLMLEETPWVLDAKDETERKKRVALLFDLNKMSNELNAALLKLQKKQTPNGAWPWFDGMPDDRYITQYIIEGFGHLDHLGIKSVREDDKTWNMVKRALQYLDGEIKGDYDNLIKGKADLSKNNLSALQIQYLYTRSYFKDVPVNSDSKKAFDYFKDQSKKFWLNNGEYLEGMIALELSRYDDKSTASDILKSLKENSQNNEEMGMYWKNNTGGYYWMQAPIETQSLLIEAFDEITNDQKAVDDMKVWLLKQKQTQDWKTTKATAEACYALLLRGTNWLAESTPVVITVGTQKINPTEMPDLKAEAGTGYFKTSWSGKEINPEMANVTMENKNESVAWGAMYWQYFEQLDKITPHQTPLNMKKELFLEKPSATGPVISPVNEQTILKPGDRIKVRIELRVDRDMEYVMMKDMRGACFEPEQVLSQYKWQDGLGYYETTRDASVNFFFSYIQKGTYVFEYPLRVSQNGNFSNGISEIQCMYAPEFTSHSEGIRVKVGK